MKVAVTGANGFVGRALCERLEAEQVLVRRIVRVATGRANEVVIPDSLSQQHWEVALGEIDAVVHLAARVHVMHDSVADPAQAFRQVNCEMTRQLASASVRRGVRRFVFVSTIKVNGEGAQAPYREVDAPRPEDHYSQSKLDAERALMECSAHSSMQGIVLRPPLVYGPGVGGNFVRLLRAVWKGYPLPLAHVRNQRSLIYLANLVDAIMLAVRHPDARGMYVVRDGEDLSTPDLIQRLARAMGVPDRLLPLPIPVMRAAAAVLGRRGALDRLVGSLQIDDSRIRDELGWDPPFSVDAGLERTARWYLSTHADRKAG